MNDTRRIEDKKKENGVGRVNSKKRGYIYNNFLTFLWQPILVFPSLALIDSLPE